VIFAERIMQILSLNKHNDVTLYSNSITRVLYIHYMIRDIEPHPVGTDNTTMMTWDTKHPWLAVMIDTRAREY
jgi:hypothetical protein